VRELGARGRGGGKGHVARLLIDPEKRLKEEEYLK